MPRMDGPELRSLSDLIAGQAEARPHVEALISEGRRWTYAALQRGVWRIALELSRGGVQAGDRVLLMAPTCDSFVVSFFALVHLGAIPVPISPRLLEVEVIGHARDCDAKLLMADASTSETLRETFIRACQGRVIRLDPRREQICWQTEEGEHPQVHYFDLPFEAVPPAHEPDPDDVATILYTSGTTGTPKGVCLTHRGLIANARAIAETLPMTEHPSTAIALPLNHAYPLISQLLSTLLIGGTVQLFRGLAFAFPVLQEIQREAIESFSGMPSTFRMLAQLEDLSELDLSCVRYVCSAGAPLRPEDLPCIRQVFPQARIFNNYGLSEAGPRVAAIEDSDPAFHRGSVGKAIAGVRLRVIADGVPAGPGVVGEVQIQTPAVMVGYWNAPAESQLAREGEWLRTRDMGYLDADGYLFLYGRREDVVTSGGDKISPFEVEDVLQRHPSIREAAVIGAADPMRGERIVAWVVPTVEAFDPQEAIRHCTSHLARHKCPHEVRLLDRLPKTKNGKIQRHKLREWAETESAPEPTV
ncbi:MAG TPA: class I adenylate-forming enzyme family protein [Stenomitos sp.]